MFGSLLRAVVVVLIVVGLAAFFMGYRWGNDGVIAPGPDRAIGTTGAAGVDRARGVGADIGERVVEGVEEAKDAAVNATLTAKIKSKMALDDHVKALDIDIDTNGSVVTVGGRTSTDAERQRALALARETEGVTAVVDRIVVTHQ